MNCKRIKAKLDLLAGDDLSGRDAAEVEGHLRQCLSCYRDYVELREMVVAVRAASRPDELVRSRAERESFVAGVMNRIQGPPPALPRLMPRVAMVSGWAAALLLGLTLGWYRWQLNQNGASPRPGPVIEITPSNLSPTTIDHEVQSQIDELRGQPASAVPHRGDEARPVKRWPPKSY
jgi:anti-sigma factor RsiW